MKTKDLLNNLSNTRVIVALACMMLLCNCIASKPMMSPLDAYEDRHAKSIKQQHNALDSIAFGRLQKMR